VTDSPSTPTPDVKVFSEALYKQVMSLMGVKHPSISSRCLSLIFKYPIHRLSKLLVEVDRSTAERGWSTATQEIMDKFISNVQLQGEDNIPNSGPLLVVANHPAAYDFVILSAVLKRDDLKILASDVPIVKMLPNIAEHFIPVPYDIPSRLQTVRNTLKQLNQGGAILIFPRGNVEPDPAVSPGAEEYLEGWSSSIELFLRRVPETISIVAVASGILSAKWYNNPIIKRWKKFEQRQKVAEIFQVATQLLSGRKPKIAPKFTFSEPLTVRELGGVESAEGTLLAGLTNQAKNLLLQHPHS
jgi:hypothetical protein